MRRLVGARLRLPGLLRPGRRLLIASVALAFGLAWWCERREMFWVVVGAPAWACWLGAVGVWVGLVTAMARVEVPMADDPVPASLDPYDAAWLRGGTWRMVATAMAMQVQRGSAVIELDSRATNERPLARWRVTRADAPAHAVERAIARAAPEGIVDVLEARRAVRPLACDAGRRLRAAGLAEFRGAIPVWQLGALIVCGAVLLLAAMRFGHTFDDMDRGSPFDLFLPMIAAGMLALFVMPADRTTASGRLALHPHLRRAQHASATRALALGQAPEADRAAQAAQRPIDVMTLAVYANSAVVDDPRFASAWHLWPGEARIAAWHGGGNVSSIHASAND